MHTYQTNGPLNTKVFTNTCSVYRSEMKSILGQACVSGALRKPLSACTIGTSFHHILILENMQLPGAVPRVVPVSISDACRNQLRTNKLLRIARATPHNYRLRLFRPLA